MVQLSYRRHRFPAEIIQHAIWLYLRFTLSYRDVEELLAERGLAARHRYIRFPAIRTTISSRCHCALGRGRPCRSLRAIRGPNFSTQRRTVS
jgi:hypothetical protein